MISRTPTRHGMAVVGQQPGSGATCSAWLRGSAVKQMEGSASVPRFIKTPLREGTAIGGGGLDARGMGWDGHRPALLLLVLRLLAQGQSVPVSQWQSSTEPTHPSSVSSQTPDRLTVSLRFDAPRNLASDEKARRSPSLRGTEL